MIAGGTAIDTRLVIGGVILRQLRRPLFIERVENEAPLRGNRFAYHHHNVRTTKVLKADRDRSIPHPPSCPKDRNAVAFTEAAPPPSGHRHGVPLLSRSWIVKFESSGAKQFDDTKIGS